jgi:hypothetical protein
VLGAKVQRAAVLITFCRARITDARLQIDTALADLAADD